MDFMDCHALPRKARNDGVGALYEKVDSKILEIESWLFKARKEDKT